MSKPFLSSFLFVGLSLLGIGAAHSQTFSTAPCSDNNGDGGWFNHAQACELRRAVLPRGNGHVEVSGKNGNIELVGEDRADIALEAKVTASGGSRSDAEKLLHEVKVLTNDGNIRAEGPTASGFFSHGWSVSFKLRVPRRMVQADLHTSNGNIDANDLEGRLVAESSNGGIRIRHVEGEVRAASTNGELNLQDLRGSVHAETTNGGVDISLAGSHWEGTGLFAKSTNGGISIKAPANFAAHIVAQTTNGGISVGFPIQVQGKIGRSIDTNVNGGGPLVQLETTNGGISLERL